MKNTILRLMTVKKKKKSLVLLLFNNEASKVVQRCGYVYVGFRMLQL